LQINHLNYRLTGKRRCPWVVALAIYFGHKTKHN
jgi:hypothetical protein